ncbi:Piwi-like 2, partial [Tauraco erythrolophus]
LVLLVPELTFMTGLPDMRKDSRMVKDVMRELLQSPRQHYTRLTSLLRRIKDSPEASDELMSWGLRLDPDIHRIQGRVLPVERINMRHSSFLPAEDLSWNKEITREASISAVSSRLSPCNNIPLFENWDGRLMCLLGRAVQPPGVVSDPCASNALPCCASPQDKVQLVLCLISSNREDLYGAIKKLCCVQSPVPSQVGLKVVPSLNTTLSKVSTGVFVLGVAGCRRGRWWPLARPRCHIAEKGAASAKPGSASVVQQLSGLWLVRRVPNAHPCSIPSILTKCDLFQFLLAQMNHCLPRKIVVYRDGVSDSQLNTVLKYEIPQMQKCFDTFENYQPGMVVVVVQKQISTNFYTLVADQFVSPPPGTVIDHTVTSSDWQDFFLLAHCSRQGCSIPTRYRSGPEALGCRGALTPPLLSLSKKLYWNWPGTIRVPAPCKYAHKLAFLSGQVLHHEASARLCDKLFFL